MNLDLFSNADVPGPAEYDEAFRRWLAKTERAGLVQRESSAEVYEHMWSALTAWAVGNGLRLADIRASDLESFLESRGGSSELSARYANRLLHLVNRVLSHHARVHGLSPITAATALMAYRPDIRFAN